MSGSEFVEKKSSSVPNQMHNSLQPRRLQIPLQAQSDHSVQETASIEEQLERASKFGYDGLDVPVNAPTPSPLVQTKLNLEGGENEYQAQEVETVNPVLNGLNQLKVQRLTEDNQEASLEQLPNSISLTNPLIQRDQTEQTERVEGKLWATDAEGKILPPSLEDISQGGVGDCFLFAAMAAIVNTNPQQIVNMIQDNGNGTYTVTFKGIGFFSSAKQTVSADFAVGKHGNVKRKALWPLIIEKAYAQEKGGIDVLDKGGNPGSAIDDMINDGPSRFDPREKSADYIMGKLAKAKEKKWPMTILAPKKDGASKDKKEMADNTPGLHFNHAYTIIDIDPSTKRIKLFNPWGHDHPNGDGWMDIDQVRKFFIEVNIND
ncbi:MAG TPA: hypothetical protein DD379_20185 [Cyanobacteria bacterium UBA11162]|nr:hypothetical protein [Cyanobacteria bacterium UBA11162]